MLLLKNTLGIVMKVTPHGLLRCVFRFLFQKATISYGTGILGFGLSYSIEVVISNYTLFIVKPYYP